MLDTLPDPSVARAEMLCRPLSTVCVLNEYDQLRGTGRKDPCAAVDADLNLRDCDVVAGRARNRDRAGDRRVIGGREQIEVGGIDS